MRTALLLLLGACANASLPTEIPEATLLAPITFQGVCQPVNPAVSCDIQFVGDKDIGTASVYYQNQTSWLMQSIVNSGKEVAVFAFKARYRDSWGRVGPWSKQISFTYNPMTFVTTPRVPMGATIPPMCYGTVCLAQPNPARLTYTFVP